MRPQPFQLRAGEFKNPLDTRAELERGAQEGKADASRPKFHGWLSGIYLGSDPPSSVRIFPCEKQAVRSLGQPDDESVLKNSPYWFDPPTYLPPGTSEWTYPYGHACGDEPAFGIGRDFVVKGGELSIYRTWQVFFPRDFSTSRVSTGTIAGRPAVIVAPLTPEGYGDTHVIVAEAGGGTVRVSGYAMPLDEVRRIMEALLSDFA